MTRLLISTAIAGILAFGGAAFAQGDDHHRDDGRPAGGHEQQQRPAPQAAAPARQPDNRGRQPAAAPQAAPAAAPAPRNAMRGPDNRDQGNRSQDNRGQNNRGFDNRDAGNRTFGNRGPAVGNAMRGPAPAHRDYSSYHRNFSASHRFRAPVTYRRPSGWYAHRWSYGEILPSLFWASDYWLNDYYDFGLMQPPGGTVWVRDGDDALLIDQYSGEIIQVEYSVFY